MGIFGNRLYFNSVYSKSIKRIPPPQKNVSIIAVIMAFILTALFILGLLAMGIGILKVAKELL
jgi:hypothetical protein